MAIYRLPLDLTGTAASNRVTQTRTLNISSKMGDKFFIPADAPFFSEGLEIFKVGTPTPLTRGVDYELIFEYPDIFQMTQKFVYGGIKFKDRKISGQVKFVGQVLGGPFLQPVQNTLETIARNKTNVNTGTWGEIAGVPAGFPVLNHPMISDDIIGFGDINNTLAEGVALLLNGQGGGSGGDGNAAMVALQNHLKNPTNAHNKAAVGLGNVPNFSLSTYEEADVGVNNKLTSPAIVKYLISKYSGLSAIVDLQQQLSVLRRDMDVTVKGLQDNDIAVANLTRTVDSVVGQFDNVKKEFANVLNYINDLGLSIETIQTVVLDLRVQVEDALLRVSDMEKTVQALKMENENIASELTNISISLSTMSKDIETLQVTLDTVSKDVGKLNTETLYPKTRYVNAGTFNFSIKKGETRKITLVGPGGAGGVLIPIGEDGIVEPRGYRGGDTYLILNTDLTNGNKTVGEIVLKAESGQGGQSSSQNTFGVEFFGKGGKGGATQYTGLFTVETNSFGADGKDGDASGAPSHAGAAGQVLLGKKFADGGACVSTAGSGGAGAMLVGKITNTYDFDLEFTAIVGEPVRNLHGNNFLLPSPGIIIIDVN